MTESSALAALPALPELRFRLPGTWAQIPLHTTTGAKAAIHKLVARQIGTTDEAATAREQLRRQFLEALREAIAGDAQSMQIALEIIENVPTPVAFTVFLPQQQLTPSIGTTPVEVAKILEQGLRSRADVDLETVTRLMAGDSEVIRTHRIQLSEPDPESAPLRVLVVDYWMTVPGTKRFLLVNFHTALADAMTEMTTLFDAIIRASYWVAPRAGQA